MNLISTVEGVARQLEGKGAILSLDLSKAYDRVNLRYLQQVMEAMNIPVEFVSWVLISVLKWVLFPDLGRLTDHIDKIGLLLVVFCSMKSFFHNSAAYFFIFLLQIVVFAKNMETGQDDSFKSSFLLESEQSS